ncbi:MAG: branched-chain amino acid transaminase [Deltaproteobacteria bacterium]|nr:branched-chain amino acid transaminase [Deltaproteobacteria bacterium]
MSFGNSKFIWYDGKFVPWQQATTNVMTHSLHYGVSAFEGIRAYNTENDGGAIFRLFEHLRRLANTTKIFRMPMPYDTQILADAIIRLLQHNQLEQAYIRPIVFYGSNKLGLSVQGVDVHVAIAAWPWEAYLGKSAIKNGINAKISSFRRPSNNAHLTRAKIAALYANSILAKMEAYEDGYDEALLLDNDGCIAEATGENVFIVKDGHLFEPEPTAALLGITRDTIVKLAKDRGIKTTPCRLTRDDLYLADELFIVGTAAEIVPIVHLDKRIINEGVPGSITNILCQAYADVVRGRISQYYNWLTFIRDTPS